METFSEQIRKKILQKSIRIEGLKDSISTESIP